MIKTACVIGLLATPAAAQTLKTLQLPCNTRDSVTAALAVGYGEHTRIQALDGRGLMFEVFASAETGTWTATLTDPNGLTCVVATGEAVEFVDEALTGPDY